MSENTHILRDADATSTVSSQSITIIPHSFDQVSVIEPPVVAQLPLTVTLPLEMLSSICQWLPKKDNCSMRLTCKILEAAANPHVFSEIHLSLIPASFESMNRISQCEKFRKCVKTLLFDGSVLDTLDRTRFEQFMKLPAGRGEYCGGARGEPRNLHRCSKGCHYTTEELDAQWENYESTQNSVATLDPERMASLLAVSFAGFPVLEDIRIITNDLCGDQAWRQGFPGFKNLVFTLANLPYRPCSISRLTIPRGRQQVCLILSAVRRSSFKLKHLDIETVYWKHFEETKLSHNNESALSPEVCSRLKSIDLEISDFYDFDEDNMVSSVSQEHSDKRQRRLGEALAFANDLQRLSLNFVRMDQMDRENDTNAINETRILVKASEIFGDTTWMKLEELNLRHLDITDPTQFLDFLTRHSRTLKSLKMFDVCTTSIAWDVLLSGIKDATYLEFFTLEESELDEPEIGNCFGTSSSIGYTEIYDSTQANRISTLQEAIEKWVLGKGPKPNEVSVQISADGSEEAWNTTLVHFISCPVSPCNGARAAKANLIDAEWEGDADDFAFRKCTTCGHEWTEPELDGYEPPAIVRRNGVE